MKKICPPAILILLLLSFVSLATVRTVPAQYATIQSALDACSDFDTVLVSPGTYMENIVWPAALHLKLLSSGNSSNTIIDGGHAGTVLDISVFYPDSGIVVRGFTIQNGYAQSGGGIFILEKGVLLQDLVIQKNHIEAPNWAQGAGILCADANLTMINVQVLENKVDSGTYSQGTGAYFETSTVNMVDCNFSFNTALSVTWGQGGGIFGESADITMSNVQISENTLNANTWAQGAAGYFEYGTIHINDCDLSSNNANSNDFCHGACLYFGDCDLEMNRTTIEGNHGGVNTSHCFGAGIYAANTNATLTNVLIAGNSFLSSGSYHNGGAISVEYLFGTMQWFKLINCTVANNNSGAIASNSIYNDEGSVSATNSIIWSFQPGDDIQTEVYGQTVIDHSDVQGGYAGTGNLDLDPAFISMTDFHLQLTSPCLAGGTLTGAPLDDLESNPRPMPSGNNPEMGAYEMDELNGISSLPDDATAAAVYPNPFHDAGYLKLKNILLNQTYSVVILDTYGRIVRTLSVKNPERIEIDRNDLPAGLYAFQITTPEKKFYSGKFIIQ